MDNNEIFYGLEVLSKVLLAYKDVKIPIIYDKSPFNSPEEEEEFERKVIEEGIISGYPANGKGIQNFVTHSKHTLAVPAAAERKILELIELITIDKKTKP